MEARTDGTNEKDMHAADLSLRCCLQSVFDTRSCQRNSVHVSAEPLPLARELEWDLERFLFSQIWLRRFLESVVLGATLVYAMVDLYEKCKKDIQSIGDLLETQQTALPGSDMTKAVATQSANVLRRLRSIRLITPEQMIEIQSTILQGPWTQSQKEEMVAVLTEQQAKGSANSSSPQQQMVEDFVPFLSVHDVGVLSNPNVSHLVKLQVMSDRCMAIGVLHPTETSYRNILSAAVATGLTLTPDERLPYLGELKRLVRSAAKKTQRPEPYLHKYPTAAGDLPAALRACYEDDPVATVEGGSARALSAGLHCRRSRGRAAPLAIVPASSSGHGTVPQPGMGTMVGGMPMAGMGGMPMVGMGGMGGKGGMPALDPSHPMFGMFMGMMNQMNQYNMMMMMQHGQGDRDIRIQMNNTATSARAAASPSSPVEPRQLFNVGVSDSLEDGDDGNTAPAPEASEAAQKAPELGIVECALIAREQAKTNAKPKPKAASPKVESSKPKSKPKAKAKGTSSKAKVKSAAKAKAASSKAKAASEPKAMKSSAAASSSGIKGKSIYGVERDAFKAAWTKDGSWEEGWKASKECQTVLAKMSHSERVKRRLDHLYKGK